MGAGSGYSDLNEDKKDINVLGLEIVLLSLID